MARHTSEAGNHIYAAADQFVDRCLRRDDSLFTPGRAVWSARAAQELKTRFVDNPGLGSDTFMEKLRRQISGGSQEATQLLAEMLYVYFLLPNSVKGAKKRSTINEVLSWAPQPVAIPDDLSATLEHGICHGGMSFNTHRPFFLFHLIAFTQDWKALTQQERDRLLGDPFAFKALVYQRPADRSAGQQMSLLHVVHPDAFEAIYSSAHKRAIAEFYGDYVDDETEDIDAQILQIREGLKADNPDFTGFYSAPYKEQWLAPGKKIKPPSRRRGPQDPATVIARLLPEESTRRPILEALAWSLTTAHDQNEECWSLTLRKHLIRLNVGTFMAFDVTRKGVNVTVLGKQARDVVAGIAGATFNPDPFKAMPDAYLIEIEPESFPEAWERLRDLHRMLLARSSAHKAPWSGAHSHAFVEHLSQILGKQLPNRPDGGGRTSPGPSITPVPGVISLADLEDELFLENGSLELITQLLADKRQVVFHGPPGTGKTFIARRLARHLVGGDGRVEIVQFHPSYAYEDFVEGFRPQSVNGQPGFALVEGPLKRLALEARAKPDATFVLIIDELNRGNVAKVFGELYFLLEYRDEEIALQYCRTPFSLPPNLLIIGTMNTADRSIALVDLALRRRFHFAPFFPDRAPIKGVLRRWLATHADDMSWIADMVDHANGLIPDRHVAIGPSHFMKTEMDDEWVAMVWDHSVLPYLEEQFFGNEEQLLAFGFERLRRQVSRLSTADERSEGLGLGSVITEESPDA